MESQDRRATADKTALLREVKLRILEERLTRRTHPPGARDAVLDEWIAEFLGSASPLRKIAEPAAREAAGFAKPALATFASAPDAGRESLWRPPVAGAPGGTVAARPALRPLRSILYVEDDAKFRELITMVLTTDRRITVHDCGSGAEALELARLKEPDLILLDYRMPGLDGGQTLGCLRALEQTAHIPVIFMTGLGLEPEILRHAPQGMIGVIEKPVRAERLLRDIRALWDGYVAGAGAGAGAGARSDTHERSES